MKIKKTSYTQIVESILAKLNTDTESPTGKEVVMRYLNNGFLLVDFETSRRVSVTVLTDNDGIQLECDIAGEKGYANLIMNRLKEDEISLAAEYIWNWLNVDKGFVMNVNAGGGLESFKVTRYEPSNITRTRLEG